MKEPSLSWSISGTRVRSLCCAAIVFCCLVSSRPTGIVVAQKSRGDKPWQELVSTEGRFRVLMPDIPEDRFVPVIGQIVDTEMHAYFARNAAAGCVVAFVDFPHASKDPRVLQKAFDNGRARALADGKARLISEKDISTAALPGREFVIDDGVNVTRDRLYYSNGRLYQVIFIAPQLSGMSDELISFYDRLAAKFFGSFKIVS